MGLKRKNKSLAFTENKITHFIQSVIFSVKFNISSIVEPYIISSVKLHIPTECYQ